VPGAVVPGALVPGAVVLPGLDCVPGVIVPGEFVPEPVELGLAVPGCALPDGEVDPDGLGVDGDALGVFTVPLESMQGVVLPGAVVPGNVLGGLAGDPGALCEFDVLGVMPGTDPDPLFIGEQGGKLLGVLCAPGVAVLAPGVAVLAPGVAVLAPGVAVLAPGVAVLAPGVAVPGEDGVAVPGGVEVLDWPGFAVPGEFWLGELGVWPGVEVFGVDEVPAGFDAGLWAATAVATAKVPLSSMLVTIRFFFIRVSKRSISKLKLKVRSGQ
jgi:hypothetical protein